MTIKTTALRDSVMNAKKRIRDASGYIVFSHGNVGIVHVFAHRALDKRHSSIGHQLLGDWLARRNGSGSEWLHLHFHMAVFELALGDWQAAHDRFMREILPAASSTADALTDAPALLWRLEIEAPSPVTLPWEALRDTARRRMHRGDNAFIELHNLLALAGAGDVSTLESWAKQAARNDWSTKAGLLSRAAFALRDLAARSFGDAAVALQRLTPDLNQLGGSRAQCELYESLVAWCWRQANESNPAMRGYAHAA